MVRIPHFLRPTMLKAALAILCLGLSLMFVVPLFSHLKMVPCRLVDQGAWALCNVDPSSQAGSFYLGLMATDWLYSVLYLLLILIVIPYCMACCIFWCYERIMKKALNNNRD